MAILYLVATPIGNLEDITLRALRILKEVSLIAAEDTRTTSYLLNHFDIKNRLISYNDHNRAARIPILLKALGEGDVALVSEAGTPGVSDPGRELVQAALLNGVDVVPIPGPSALTAAAVVSGFSTAPLLFLGFLPRRAKDRRNLLKSVKGYPFTLVAFEAPHRLRKTLEDVREELGDRPMAVCRELTKLHEEVLRGTVSQALDHFLQPRGEFTLVIEGSSSGAWSVPAPLADIESLLEELAKAGLTAKEAVARLVSAGLSRREAYRLWTARRRDAKARP